MDSSKRRRLDNPAPRTPRTPTQRSNTNAPARSPIESSSDELAAGSDHDEQRRRTSWTIQKTYPPKRPYPRSRSFSESESSDELAVDAEVYWRSRNRGRSPTQSQSNMSSQEDIEDDEGEGEENEGGDSEAGDAEDDVNEADEDAHSNRSPTPVPPPPPPPPPKPEKLNYRQKYLLRGHLRGVSAVRFSPDASMLASAGMPFFFFFFPIFLLCVQGRLLTGTGADGAIKVWDTLSGKLIHTFEGHLAGVSTIAWSPDCATIASGSDDKTIRLWNVLTVRCDLIISH